MGNGMVSVMDAAAGGTCLYHLYPSTRTILMSVEVAAAPVWLPLECVVVFMYPLDFFVIVVPLMLPDHHAC